MRQSPLNKIELLPDTRALIERSAQFNSGKSAFLELDHLSTLINISYAKFLSDVRHIGTALLSKGYAQKRIAIIGENSYAWVLGYFSIINSGITAVPIDKDLSCNDIADQIERAQVDAICCTEKYKSETVEVINTIHLHYKRTLELVELGSLTTENLAKELFALGEDEIHNNNNYYDRVKLDPSSVCCIMFTSGTTGKSKGVQLSYGNLTANIKSAMELVTYRTEDVFVSVLPIHHSFEAMAGILCPIYHGSTIGFCPSVREMSKCFEAYKPTALCLVPLHVETFQKKILREVKEKYGEKRLEAALEPDVLKKQIDIELIDLLRSEACTVFGGRLGLIVAGGASVAPRQISFYRRLGIDLVQGYGVTECSPVVASNQNNNPIDNSVGRVASCAEVKIDKEGQVLVKGASVMKGYLNEEDESFVDGWFPTGDLGYFKEDYLYITGRCSDVIVLSNGKNIMPQEIEQSLMSFDSITEAVVIAGPSKGNGSEYLVAHIYPNYDLINSTYDIEDAMIAIDKRVTEDVQCLNRDSLSHKRIYGVVLHRQPFKKTTTRKVRRYLLKGKTEGMIHV